MNFTVEQAQLKRELANEYKLEENIQNDAERDQIVKIQKS